MTLDQILIKLCMTQVEIANLYKVKSNNSDKTKLIHKHIPDAHPKLQIFLSKLSKV
jgi:hypothetical protein